MSGTLPMMISRPSPNPTSARRTCALYPSIGRNADFSIRPSQACQQMNQHGAPGVDRISMAEYGQDLDARVADLAERMKRRAYDAPNVRRTYIEKRGNPSKLRPLGIPVVEDRLLQAAVARILGVIYEPIFRNGSFGFRPGRSAHGALRVVRETVESGEAQWVYEADIKGFFGAPG